MNPERWRKIESICNSALDMEPVRRKAFLDEACAEDASLRREVEQLLGMQSEAEDFIERPALEGIKGLVESGAQASGEFDTLSGKTLGHYRVVSRLGRGGMGEVFLAEDTSLDRKVALKFLPGVFTGDQERMARFEREAKLLASLSHPNIAAIHGLERLEGMHFLVLELAEGETLEQKLHKGALPLEEALGICRRIAEGLAAAHEKGVIHRDLKPANVIIDGEDNVKILDFGLAKALSGQTRSVDASQSPTITEMMTLPGVILGTAAYMSPEQAKGKAVDKRADIWAFGCILYECLAGRRAFEGETITETLAAVLKSEPDWRALPGTIPSNIGFVLRRCLEKDMNRRLQSAADLRFLIEDTFGAGESKKPAKRSWLAWSLAAVFLAAALALSWSHFRDRTPRVAEPVRFEILPRGDLDWGGAFAVSPDGRNLAFSGIGADGRRCAWIRPLGSLEARPVRGTESEHIPSLFWSPDSRFIAWGTGGKLRKADINGTLVQPVCDIPQYTIGGSWNRDDVILFGTYSSTGAGGLMRVSAAGGTASDLTKLDPNRQEQAHWFPTFLSDGRHFLYWQNSSIPQNRGVYLGSLDSGSGKQDTRLLLPTEFGHVYVPPEDSGPGHILFLREKVLLSQQFDEKGLKLFGEPIQVAEQVGSFSIYGFFSASTNGVLIHRSGGSEQYAQAAWFDRQGQSLGAAGLPVGNRGLALSPDGKRAAISAMSPIPQAGVNLDILLRDFARGITTRFTFGATDNRFPVWSPDGSCIIFASNRDAAALNLYEKPLSGISDEELLLKTEEHKFPTSWSRDARFLLYTALDPQTGADIYVLPREDRKPKELVRTAANELDARFSPDMRWVAYVSDESGGYEVYVRDFSKSPGMPVETGVKVQISAEGGLGPRWGKDGRELYYRTRDGKVMVVNVAAGTPFRPGIPRVLFEAPRDPIADSTQAIPLSAWDVTSDGNRFLLSIPSVDTKPAPFNVILHWTSLLK